MKRLTLQLRDKLSVFGFKYYLLKDVRRIEADMPGCYILVPVKKLNADDLAYVNANDSILSTVLEDTSSQVELFVEIPAGMRI